MKRIINSNSLTFNKQAIELTKIFFDYKKFTSNMKVKLENLGYKIYYSNKHYKCYYEKKIVAIISSTPSDKNTGNQTLRQFRFFWENYEK